MSDDYYLDPRIAAVYDSGAELPLDDVPFYVSLAREAAAQGEGVLELACGTGRVTIPIAQAGADVVGLDASPAMLDVARRKAAGLTNPRWVQGDMASFRLEQRFGLVIIPYRSFLLLLTVADQKACLTRVWEHLLPGGRLALNFFNPSLVMMGEWLSSRRGSLQRLPLGKDASGRPVESWQTNHYASASQQLDHLRLTEELDDDGTVISRTYRNLRLRYVFRYEMEHLLALCGFAVEALYGWFDRRPFDDASDEMVWLARRPTVKDS